MKKLAMITLLVFVLFLAAACGEDHTAPAATVANGGISGGGTGEKSPESTQGGEYDSIIASAGVESVTYEILSENGQSVFVKASVPNYTELLTDAMKAENPEKAFADAITNGAYTTVEYEGYANKTANENGEETADIDALLRTFVEKELIKAINTVMEAENGGTQE